MSSIDSTTDNVSKSLPMNDLETSVPFTDKISHTKLINMGRLKQKLTSQKYRQITDKLLEIEQINCEELLVNEEINRLNHQRQYLQSLINILHAMDTKHSMKKSCSRRRRLQRNKA
ncbi:hypothetical protein I4U23_009602 [Adineta vaga]|nr:hypothetical protein I4U23_009602 [Adineta vaga]